jgi:multiple sugar transport system permease protein
MSIKTATTLSNHPNEQRAWVKRLFNGEAMTAWFFLLPSLVGFIVFYAVPAFRGLVVSFTNWDMLQEPQFTGFENYTRLLQDPDFWHALEVTSLYVLWNIPIQTVLALLLAVMMDRLTHSSFLRGIIVLPWLMPNVVVGLLWLWLMDPTVGLINVAIKGLGLQTIPFLGSPDLAIPSIALINIWRHMGYTALLIFAGLQTIDRKLYEAASVDGATESKMFWQITLPLLRPVLVFVLVTTIVGSFQIFDTIAITTKGGPIVATKVINWLIYEHAFVRFNMGYASAIAVVLFLILIVVSLIQMRLMRAGEVD